MPLESKSETEPAPYGLALIFLLAVITAYRALALSASGLQLYFDEAYYWTWSRQPDFGYYSKPPMIAWAMNGASSVCGDGELCLRSVSLLLFPLAAGLVFLVAKRLFDARIGFFAGLAYAGLPVVAFYSWLMTTDVLLSFFWALALFGLAEALHGDRWRHWLLTGAAIGCGLLSKYTMIFFVVSALIYGIVEPERRSRLCSRKGLAALALGCLLFLPNVIWNIQHHFASFQHTAEDAQWGRSWFHPDHLLIFLGGQILLFGPLLALAPFLGRKRIAGLWPQDSRYRFLLCFSLPILLVYGVQAFLARANLNWGLAAFVSASIVAAAWLVRSQKPRMLIGALAVNFFLGAGIYHYGGLAERMGITLGRDSDAYASMKGWQQLGTAVSAALVRYPDAGLAADNRRVLSELIYYIRPHPLDGVIWNPSRAISDQFRLKADLRQSARQSFIFVTDSIPISALRPHFREAVDLGAVEIPIHPDLAHRYRVFWLKQFLGYPS